MKKILIIMVLMSLMMMTFAVAETPRRNVGVQVCMPGYGGADCVYNECYGWSNPPLGATYEECMANQACDEGFSRIDGVCVDDNCKIGFTFVDDNCEANDCILDNNYYETEIECEEDNVEAFIQIATQSRFQNQDLSDEQVISFYDDISEKVEDGSTIEEALEELEQEREQIRVQMQEQMQGSLRDDTTVINSFEVKNNYSLEKVNATIYSQRDTKTSDIENMKQVAETFQERNMFQYNTFEMIPIDVNNTLIVIERQGQFLFFDVDIKDKYIVDNFASVVEQKRTFWSYMVGRT